MFNINLQGAFTYVIESTATTTEMAYFVQAGYLIINKIQPYFKFWANNATTDTSSIMLGCNYFFKGHNANIKAEFGYPLMDSKNMQVNIQTQIFL